MIINVENTNAKEDYSHNVSNLKTGVGSIIFLVTMANTARIVPIAEPTLTGFESEKLVSVLCQLQLIFPAFLRS